MKKVIPLLIAIFLSGCSLVVKEQPVNLVTVDDIQNKLNSKDSFILVVGNKERCGTCESYLKGGLRGLHDKKEYKADYITIDTINKQVEMDALSKILYKKLGETEKVIGVPSTYVISNGKIVKRLKGPILYDDIRKDYDSYIKK